MNIRNATLWTALLALLMLNPAWSIQVGEPAPDFELLDTNGATHRLSDHLGQVVFLNFFGYSCPTCQSQGGTTETDINQYYAGQAFQAFGIDIWNGPGPSVVAQYGNPTGITYPLLVNGGATGTAYNVDRQYLIIGPDGTVRYISDLHQLDVPQLREVIDTWLPTDDPTFSFVMSEETMPYVPVTQDSSHWPLPYDFHGIITNLVDAPITLAITLTPVSPTAEQERRQYGICHQLFCYATTHGTQLHYGQYESGEVDTLAKFSVTWQVTGDQGFPELADLAGDYIFDVSVYDSTAPEDAVTYRLQLIETQDAVTIKPVLMPNSTKLLSNYPNPFNPSTNINFIVEQAGPVNVAVYDILGRTVAELVNSTMQAGVYNAFWDAKSSAGVTLPSGSYWVRLNTPTQKAMHRIVLIR